MVKASYDARIKRLIIGILAPNFFGSIVLSAMLILIQIPNSIKELDNFIFFLPSFFLTTLCAILLGYLYTGLQSIIYSFLMEFLVLKYIKNMSLAIFISVLLCLAFPFWFMMFQVDANPLKLGILFYSCGGIAGCIVGIILYNSYHKQYS